MSAAFFVCVSRGRGTLKFALDEIPPPPSIVTTVNRTASFDAKSGSATVSGTVTCDADADFGFLDLSLRQRVGRVFIQGFGSTELACTGAPEAWSVIVVGGNGLFKGGKTASVSLAVACASGGCSEYVDEQTIQLTGKKG